MQQNETQEILKDDGRAMQGWKVILLKVCFRHSWSFDGTSPLREEWRPVPPGAPRSIQAAAGGGGKGGEKGGNGARLYEWHRRSGSPSLPSPLNGPASQAVLVAAPPPSFCSLCNQFTLGSKS